MSDGLEKDQDPLETNWLTNWEEQTIDEWENDTLSKMEDRIALENEMASQRLWQSFQNSASSISQLYKDGGPNKVSLWVPFQNSASSVTSMYKDSMDVMKKCFEMGKQYGHHRRSEELITWLKKHRRHLRREDIIGYVCGKNPPPRTKPTATLTRSSSRVSERSSPRPVPRLQSPRLPPPSDVVDRSDDLQPFRDALALQGLNGAMSNFGIRTSGSPSAAEGSAASNMDDIHGFILEEMSRRATDNSRKRNNTGDSSMGMDSPTRKRSRLL